MVGRTLLGFSLAVVGLSTYWGVHIHGKELTFRRARSEIESREGLSASATASERQLFWKEHDRELKLPEMLGMILTATGGGLGLFAFGPICERLGRRWAFILFHLGAFAMAVLLFQTYHLWSTAALWALLVVFGFWTLGMHAGYAIYFPELYPTRMRSLGAGFCFNCGRIVAAVMLVINGVLRSNEVPLEMAGTLLSVLFLAGAVIAWFGPETKGTTLAA
jgi:hypothetical protein